VPPLPIIQFMTDHSPLIKKVRKYKLMAGVLSRAPVEVNTGPVEAAILADIDDGDIKKELKLSC